MTSTRCRALFATHYHELTAAGGAGLPQLANATMRVREWQDEIIFLHEVVPGVADRSYGIQVARWPACRQPVIARASEVLERLERTGKARPPKALIDDLPLFSASRSQQRAAAPQGPSDIEKKLAALSPMSYRRARLWPSSMN